MMNRLILLSVMFLVSANAFFGNDEDGVITVRISLDGSCSSCEDQMRRISEVMIPTIDAMPSYLNGDSRSTFEFPPLHAFQITGDDSATPLRSRRRAEGSREHRACGDRRLRESNRTHALSAATSRLNILLTRWCRKNHQNSCCEKRVKVAELDVKIT